MTMAPIVRPRNTSIETRRPSSGCVTRGKYNRRVRAASLLAHAALAGAVPRQPEAPLQITAVDGIKVGHHTLTERPTGCTVVVAEAGAVGAVEVLGGAPGTTETDLLAPENLVDQVHAVFMSGGSAFGLDVAGGVRKYLSEKKI